jgi:hypothetical protein
MTDSAYGIPPDQAMPAGVAAIPVNEHLLLLVAAVVGLLVVVLLLSALLGRRPSDYPYESYDSLLSPAERSFFGVLQQALQGEFTPLAKVRLADILRVHRRVSAQRRALLSTCFMNGIGEPLLFAAGRFCLQDRIRCFHEYSRPREYPKKSHLRSDSRASFFGQFSLKDSCTREC